MDRRIKIYSLLTGILFMAWLLLPFLLDQFTGTTGNAASKRENRALAKRPSFDIFNPDLYPAAFNNFFTDRFPFREELINWWSENINMGVFKKAPPNSEVDIGRDGWLFSASERQAYEGTTSMLTSDKIELIHQSIRNRVIFYRDKGIKFYVFFPPMKSEIYPEYLPTDYQRITDSTLSQKVVSLLARDTLIPFINVNPAILKAKNKGRLYSLTDNHWNSKGAYEAYYQVICRIKKDFPVVKPIEGKDFTFIPYPGQGGNLALKLGIEKNVTETYYRPLLKNPLATDGRKAGYKAPPWFGAPDDFEHVKVVADSSLPKIVVIRDSFFIQIMPFFEQNFSKTVYIFDAWMYDLNWDIIQAEKPDIVVLEVFEPGIPGIIHQ